VLLQPPYWHTAVLALTRRFELRLLSPLGAGQEATICYGESKPNFEVRRLRAC
jgi:hypothetical protein